MPTITFDDKYTLQLGNKLVKLEYHQAAHSPGNIMIYLPKEKVMTMIDIVFPTWVPVHEFAIAEDINAYYDIYDEILSHDFDFYIGGHANLGTYKDVRIQKEYLLDIKESAIEQMESVDIGTLSKKSGESNNPLLVMNTGLNYLSDKCAKRVISNWKGKLASLDVFTESHCKRMLFHLLTD